MKNLKLHLCSLLVFAAAALYITYPLVFHFTSIATGLGDELVISWIQNWVIHALVTNPLHIFEANIYYPFHDSLAYSVLLIPTSILAAIPLWIFKEPIVTFNFTQITSFLLLGFSGYLFCFYITEDFWLSILSGLLIIFSPVVLDKRIHLQVLASEGVVLSLLFFLHFLKRGKSTLLLWSLLIFVIQTYNDFLTGYFVLFGYVTFSFVYFLTHRKLFLRLVTTKSIMYIVLSFLLIVPIAIPYFHVSAEFQYTRDIRDAIHLAIQPEDLLNSGGFSRLQPFLSLIPVKQTSAYGEIKPGFLGLVLTILTCMVFVFAWKKRQQSKTYWMFYASLTTALIGLVLSFGPALHINRVTIHKPFPILLPYALFYYLLPGFQGFRNAARWEVLFVIFIAICSCIMLKDLLKNVSKKRKVIFLFIVLSFVVFEYNPLHFVAVPQLKNFPKEYQWLQTTPKDTKIVEMPIYNWSMLPYSYQEQLRGYYNTSYFRTTMSGFTGFSPPPWQTLVTTILHDFPYDSDIQRLKQLQIHYILVHKDEFDVLYQNHFTVYKKQIADGQSIINSLQQNPQVKLVKTFGSTYIYEIL